MEVRGNEMRQFCAGDRRILPAISSRAPDTVPLRYWLFWRHLES